MIYLKTDHIEIRLMIKSDIKSIIDGFKEQNWPKPYEVLERYYHQQKNKERFVFVAVLDNKIAGYVTLLPNAKHGPYANKNIPVIVDFNVFIKFQRQGIGTKLLDICETVAKEISDYVTLSVGLHSGYGSAQRMYIKRGYIPDGTGVWYKDKPLSQYAPCNNDDDLTLHLLKTFKNRT